MCNMIINCMDKSQPLYLTRVISCDSFQYSMYIAEILISVFLYFNSKVPNSSNQLILLQTIKNIKLTWIASVSTLVVMPRNFAISAKSVPKQKATTYYAV